MSSDEGSGTASSRPQDLQEAGQRFLFGFFTLLRAAGMYDFNNRALDRPASQSVDALQPFFREGIDRVAAVALEGQFYLGEVRIQVPAKAFHFVQDLDKLLTERGVGGVIFERDVAVDEIRRFAHVFQTALSLGGLEPTEALLRTLARSGVRHVQVAHPVRLQYEGEIEAGASGEVHTTVAYAKAVSALGQLLADPTGQERLRPAHLSRIVQSIADCAGDTLDYLIGLTEFTSVQQSEARLAVDVCVVAVAVARAMKLDRGHIADLGVASLLAVTSDSESDGGVGLASTREAFGWLANRRRWTASALRRTLAVAQRGQPVRASGGLPAQHPLASIFRAAFDYVARTHGISPETGERLEPLAPVEALQAIAQAPHHAYDPIVVAHLVSVVGMYPVGTLVVLSDSRQAYVVGRDRIGGPIVLIREGPSRFGARLPLHATGADIVGVLPFANASERSAALLGADDQRRVQDVSSSVAHGPSLGRVSVHRIAVRRPKDE